jgi:hypothetical protein
MFRSSRLLVAFLLLALVSPLVLASPLALAADPVFPPGSRLGIVPPPTMEVSKTHMGFADSERRAVIFLAEQAAESYEKIAKDFSLEEMKAGGMEVLVREELPNGVLAAVRQQIGRDLTYKWALVKRVDDITAVVIAVMPEPAKAAYPDAVLRAAVTSLAVRPKLPPDQLLALLPYRVIDMGGFRLMRTTPDGTAVLTFGPKDTPLPSEQPFFMIALRPGDPPQPQDRDRFAQRALATFTSFRNTRSVSVEPIRIGTHQGHEIIAETRDDKTNDDLMMVQWLRFGTNGYMQMFGIARKDAWETVLPRMRAMRDGVEVK